MKWVIGIALALYAMEKLTEWLELRARRNRRNKPWQIAFRMNPLQERRS